MSPVRERYGEAANPVLISSSAAASLASNTIVRSSRYIPGARQQIMPKHQIQIRGGRRLPG